MMKSTKAKRQAAGKSLEYFKNRTKSSTLYEDSDTSSEVDLDNDDEDEDEDDEDDGFDSEDTVTSSPSLVLKKPQKASKKKSMPDFKKGYSFDDDEEDDDEDEDDEDETDSDLSSDEYLIKKGPVVRSRSQTPVPSTSNSSTAKQKKKLAPPQKLVIPKRLDLSSIRKKKQQEQQGQQNDQPKPQPKESSSETDSTSSSNGVASKTRRESVVNHGDFDDRIAFPRNGKHATDSAVVTDNEEDEDFEEDELMKLLHSIEEDEDEEIDVDEDEDVIEEDSINVDDDEEDLDESRLEQQEEQAIVEDLDPTELLHSPSPAFEIPRYDDSSDDEDESEEHYFEDDFFEPTVMHKPVGRGHAKKAHSDEEDDDSYLWSYFFSSGESGDEMDDTASIGAASSDPRLDEDATDDETDEDTNLPPPGQRKPIQRATEILSSASHSSRPPILASWVTSNERPIGIIDGLTTRTLSPPAATESENEDYFTRSSEQLSFKKRNRKRNWSQTSTDSEASEIALDEFIYTDELDDEVEATPGGSYIKATTVPLSAFRNRGIITPSNHYAQRRMSSSGGHKSKRGSHHREAVITPVKSVNRKMKRHKKHPSRKKASSHEPIEDILFVEPDYPNDHFLDIELSPLFAELS
ncbi:hypothetical protein TRVA0_007S02168 [Trichomonascus vanleenenianus]|uniref:uncharacterized protein n=1 Tax=Trichomonascus vanleenenianus TaxID=2268995 RepID=UPI003ECA962D